MKGGLLEEFGQLSERHLSDLLQSQSRLFGRRGHGRRHKVALLRHVVFEGSTMRKGGGGERSELTTVPDRVALDVDERVIGRRVDLGREHRVGVREVRSDWSEPLRVTREGSGDKVSFFLGLGQRRLRRVSASGRTEGDEEESSLEQSTGEGNDLAGGCLRPL